jgi:hypothetical protein
MDYSILFTNNSSNSGSLCIYQTNDNHSTNPEVVPLAWFCKAVHPTTQISFVWKQDYNFIWSDTKEIKQGMSFRTSQTWDANLTNKNYIELDYIENAYTFQNLKQGEEKGKFYIKQSAKLPYKKGSVGIGMSGKGIFMIPVQANINIILEHKPRYWITFGCFKENQVLNLTEITNKIEVTFPLNLYSMAATLNLDNTWSISANI